MAFFCPVFHRRTKQSKKNRVSVSDDSYSPWNGRLYASRSLGALSERCGRSFSSDSFDPYTAVTVTADFAPTVDDEIEVKKGEVVSALYREEDWIYVVRSGGDEGFIPLIFCASVDKNKIGGERNEVKAQSKQSRRINSLKKSVMTGSLVRNRSRSQELKNGLKTSEEEDSSLASDMRPATIARVQSPKAAENVSKFMKSLDPDSLDMDRSSETSERLGHSFLRLAPENQSVASLQPLEHKKQISRLETDSQSPVRIASISVQDLSSASSCVRDVSAIWPVKKQQSELFVKSHFGLYAAAFPFTANAEDDMTVEKNDVVAVLNRDDKNWYWVRSRRAKVEGFVPAAYLIPLSGQAVQFATDGCGKEKRADTSELLVVRDFFPEATDDLDVRSGDWVHSKQTFADSEGGFIWAFSPRTRRYGFVPITHLKAPVSTVL